MLLGRVLLQSTGAPAQLLLMPRREMGAFQQFLTYSTDAFGAEFNAPETGPGLTRKAAQCTAPGSCLSSAGRGVIHGLPTLTLQLGTRGAVWDNTAAHKVGGCGEKSLISGAMRLLGRQHGWG